jgi:hypothetical protein
LRSPNNSVLYIYTGSKIIVWSTKPGYNFQISALSSGEFIGLVADNPDEKIKLKMFHAEIINDDDKLNEEVKPL